MSRRAIAYWAISLFCAAALNYWLLPPWWAGIAVAMLVSILVDTWLKVATDL